MDKLEEEEKRDKILKESELYVQDDELFDDIG